MNQSTRITVTLSSIGVVALLALFTFANVSDSGAYGTSSHGSAYTTPGYTYPGPSQDYAITPHPGSLTYSNSYDAVARSRSGTGPVTIDRF